MCGRECPRFTWIEFTIGVEILFIQLIPHPPLPLSLSLSYPRGMYNVWKLCHEFITAQYTLQTDWNRAAKSKKHTLTHSHTTIIQKNIVFEWQSISIKRISDID